MSLKSHVLANGFKIHRLKFCENQSLWCFRFKIRFKTCLNSHLCFIVPANVFEERVHILIFYIVKHYNIFNTIHNPLTLKFFGNFKIYRDNSFLGLVRLESKALSQATNRIIKYVYSKIQDLI